MTDEAQPASAASRQPGFFHSLFSVLFPDQCRVCGEQLAELTRVPVCRPCLDGLQPLSAGAGLCNCCGLPLEAVPAGGLCGRCAADEYEFAQARSFGAYEGALREVLHLFKYQGMRPLAAPLAERMARVFREQQWEQAGFRWLVAVPLDAARRRQRGYNQAELLARELGRRVGLPLLADACRRVRTTAPQTGLTRAQRMENVRGAFGPGRRAGLLAESDVLLVDDVLTTGATLSACARALRQAGARRVSALTVARTVEHWP